MHRRDSLRAAGCATLALAVAAPAAGAAPSFHATDSNGNLVEIGQVKKTIKKKGKRAKVTRSYAATRTTRLQFNPPSATKLVGIDERPISGELYGIGDNSVVYRVNPRTGVATGVAGPGTAPFGVTLAGNAFGVDFNPTSPGGGAIRIVSDSGYNHRVGPDTGANGAMTPDAALNGGSAGATVVHAAYTESFLSLTQPMATVLYVLDSANDTAYVQNPPNAGTLTNPVEVSFDVTDVGGFDIGGRQNTGYVASQQGGGSSLYTLDPATGTGKSLGKVKRGATLTGLALVQR